MIKIEAKGKVLRGNMLPTGCDIFLTFLSGIKLFLLNWEGQSWGDKQMGHLLVTMFITCSTH